MALRDEWTWILLAASLVVYLVGELVARVVRRRRELAKLAETWGQPFRSGRSDRTADGWYRCFGANEAGAYTVDDQTWADLEMDRVFDWADRTLSALGAQILYAWLRQPRLELRGSHHRLALAEWLSSTAVRTRLQRILVDLGDRRGWGVSNVLVDPGPELWGPQWMYWILSVALVPAVVAGAVTRHPALLGLGMLIGAVNPMLHSLATKRTAGHLEGLRVVKRAIRVATRLSRVLPVEARDAFPGLGRDIAVARKAVRMSSRDGQIVTPSLAGATSDVIAEYRRAFFLTEVIAYLRSVRGIEKHREPLRRVLELVGSVDAALSVAYLRFDDARLREASGASEDRSIEARGLCHPLLPDAVPNDVQLGPRSLLVTGSNMAGKSTFLRTVGVNVLLAQSLGLACAEAFACSPLRVLASMQAHDDLGASVSLYQAELQRILELLRHGAEPPPCLVLLDEVFRGTNPADRVSASGAVLLELAPTNLVVAATHDLGLAEITHAHFDVGHFSERAGEEGVVFDYRLQPGISRRTNALELLSRLGYPDSVVHRAHELARSIPGEAASKLVGVDPATMRFPPLEHESFSSLGEVGGKAASQDSDPG